MTRNPPPPVLSEPIIDNAGIAVTDHRRAHAAKPRAAEDEGGHSMQRIQPMTRHTGTAVGAWFSGMFSVVIGLASLGTSVTFSYVINYQSQINPERFSVDTVQLFLSISWLLFLVALASASLCSTVLTFFRDHWVRDWDGENGFKSQRSVQYYAVFTLAWLSGLVIAAFVFLCLVVIAHSSYVGWTALACIITFAVLVFTIVLYQVPWWWRDNQPVQTKTTRAMT